MSARPAPNTRAGRIVNGGTNNNVGCNVKRGRRGDRVYHPWATACATVASAVQPVVTRPPEQHRS